MTPDEIAALVAENAKLKSDVAEARHLAHEQHARIDLLRQVAKNEAPAWAAGVEIARHPHHAKGLPPALPPLHEEPGA